MKPLFALLLAGLLPATAAGAQAMLPALYDLSGVDSVLNVRQAPDTGAAVLGTLPARSKGIEVIARSEDGGWGRINFREGTGWVSLDYLAAQPDPWAAGALPRDLRCFGTEPFWSVRHQGDKVTLSRPGEPDRTLTIDSVHGGAGTPQRVVVARDGEAGLTLGIAPEQCSDGMSDRGFALGAMLSEGSDAPLKGCCTIAP
ncbi:MAG: SH3 domain-containing protein [Amaricoccus sp.]